MSRSLTYGGLFEGYGGLTMGVQAVLGGELAWYSEIEPAPCKILAHHHPDVPNLGDVTKVDWTSVPKVDVITGGSPCQDLSHAGKRAGMKADTRSGLWASMCDAIDIIRPRLVVWENVRGALSAEADSAVEPCPICVGDGGRVTLRALGRVLGDLAELGYDARWYGLRAADVGGAHGRFRVFLFAQPTDALGSGLEGLADQTGASPARRHGHVESGAGGLALIPTPLSSDAGPRGGTTGYGLRDWSRAMPAPLLLPTPTVNNFKESGHCRDFGGDLTHAVNCGCDGGRLLPTPRATDGTKGGPNQRGSSGDLMLPSAVQALLPTPRATRGGSASETRDRLVPTPNVADAVKGGFEHKGGNPTLRGAAEDPTREQDWREYGPAIRRQEAAFGRPAPLPTEPGAKGQPRLSPRFVEWLMAVPEGHVTDVPGVSRNDQLKALGNGVVPPQAAAATRAFVHDIAQERAA